MEILLGYKVFNDDGNTEYFEKYYWICLIFGNPVRIALSIAWPADNLQCKLQFLIGVVLMDINIKKKLFFFFLRQKEMKNLGAIRASFLSEFTYLFTKTAYLTLESHIYLLLFFSQSFFCTIMCIYVYIYKVFVVITFPRFLMSLLMKILSEVFNIKR